MKEINKNIDVASTKNLEKDDKPSTKEIENLLKKPFDKSDIKWRIGNGRIKKDKPSATVLAYVDSRAIQDRLDSIFGIDGWYDKYAIKEGKIYECALSCKINDVWITKRDAADESNIEEIKGGYSDALKRAAVKFGIGRYLYKLPTAWAVFSDRGRYSAKLKDENKKEHWIKWNAPDIDLLVQEICPAEKDSDDISEDKYRDIIKDMGFELASVFTGMTESQIINEIRVNSNDIERAAVTVLWSKLSQEAKDIIKAYDGGVIKYCKALKWNIVDLEKIARGGQDEK